MYIYYGNCTDIDTPHSPFTFDATEFAQMLEDNDTKEISKDMFHFKVKNDPISDKGLQNII